MLPIRMDMTRDQCRTCLRCLELDAYGNMVSVLRAQGSLTEDKKRLLSELAKVLNISNERHRAEIRRAVNDEKLSTIAEQLYGPNTWTDWAIEGRRTIPLLPRSKAHTAFIELANSLSIVIATANAKKRASLQNNNANKLYNDYHDGDENDDKVNDSNSKQSSCIDNVVSLVDDLVSNEKQNEVTNNIALLSEFKHCERKRKRSFTDNDDNNLRKVKNRTIIVDLKNHIHVENNIDCITIDDSSSLLANSVEPMETSYSTSNLQKEKMTPNRTELLSIPVTCTISSSSSSSPIENIKTLSCQESSVLRPEEIISMTPILDINLKTNLRNRKTTEVNDFPDEAKSSNELSNISKLENHGSNDNNDDCISKSFNYNSEIKIVQSNVKMKVVEAGLGAKIIESDLETKVEKSQSETKKIELNLETKGNESKVQTTDIEPVHLEAKKVGTDLEIKIIESNKDAEITTLNCMENTETKVTEANLEMEIVEPGLEIIKAEPVLEQMAAETRITESILETKNIDEPTSMTNILKLSLETNVLDSGLETKPSIVESNLANKIVELDVETKIIEDDIKTTVVEAISESNIAEPILKERIMEATLITESFSPTVETKTFCSNVATEIVSPILEGDIIPSILEVKDVSTSVLENKSVSQVLEEKITSPAHDTTTFSTTETNNSEVPSSAVSLPALNVKIADQGLVNKMIGSNSEKKIIISNSTTKLVGLKLPGQIIKPKVELKIVDPILKSQILQSQLNTKIFNPESGSTTCMVQSPLGKINRSSMAKVGITLNSDKTVSLSSLPDDKLGMKKKVIVVQKGLSKTVKLSQEVLDRVMGGKNLCITRKSGSFCLRPHRPITGNNGNQVPKMVTLPGNFVNSTLKSDNRVLLNIQKNKTVEIKTDKNVNLHKKIENTNSDNENVNFEMDNSNLVEINSSISEIENSYLKNESLQFEYENKDINPETKSSSSEMIIDIDSNTVPSNLNKEGSINDRNEDFLDLPVNIHGDIVVQDDTQIIEDEISDEICINEGEYLKDFDVTNCRKDVLLPPEQEIYNFESNDNICEIQTDETTLTSELNMFPTQIVSTGSKIETFSYLEEDAIQEFIENDITEQISNADIINDYSNDAS